MSASDPSIDLVEKELKSLHRAYIIGTHGSHIPKEECIEHLEELERLCDTFGYEVVQKVECPLRKIDPGTFLGKGKLQELLEDATEKKAQVIIFDDEIQPKQQRNLEQHFNLPVIDRTELIIEVFAKAAKTREARLQVELAKVRYQLPRLRRLWTHLSRQAGTGGGGYLKGEGEKQIEIDRRLVRKRIDQLQKTIQEVRKQRNTQRSARLRSGIPAFAIVGYTNSGKSTLLRALTEANVLVEDKLFATLDTTTRKYTLPNRQQVILIDTVGFIRKIPHTLVAAFKSTLEEAVYTDILLHLIDVSHPKAEEQAEETHKVLEELGAKDRPTITVLNKIDACPDQGAICRFRIKYPNTVQISALTGAGLTDLLDKMIEVIQSLRKVVHLRIPQSHYALVSELMEQGHVISQEYEGNDILLEVEIASELEHKVLPFVHEH